ncbi:MULTISPECIES: hypothetical protein [Vibrio]|nr:MULTISPECIES: hypothetical protein [Vibrio]
MGISGRKAKANLPYHFSVVLQFSDGSGAVGGTDTGGGTDDV